MSAINARTLEERRRAVLHAALDYGAIGLPIFPVDGLGGGKRPLIKWKEGATRDRETIKQYWTRWPNAMIGMPTGKRSGYAVLDVDMKEGVDGLANLRAAGFDPFGKTRAMSRTPSGGYHFYFRYTDPIKNSAGLLAAGVDVRGDGGYVVLPPSFPDNGSDGYRFFNEAE